MSSFPTHHLPYHYSKLFSYLFLVLFPTLFNVCTTTRLPAAKSSVTTPIKLKLLHIDSPNSTYRQTYDSIEHRDKVWKEISVNRLLKMYLEKPEAAKRLLNKEDDDDVIADYYPPLTIDPTGVFLARIGVGDPVKEHLLTLDTGSNLMWVTCGHSDFQAGDYDCNTSKNCTRVLCRDYECELPTDECYFQIQTAGMHSCDPPVIINGSLLIDSFTFFDNNENAYIFATFGCGYLPAPIHDNNDNFTGSGVLGMSTSKDSAGFQFGDSFSYCIGDMYDTSYEYNSLTLGTGLLLGNSTPVLELNHTSKFYLKLQSIKIDGEALPIDPVLFDLDISHGGTILDSGSTLTFLADDAHIVLHDKLKQVMDSDPTDGFLCVENLKPYQVPKVEFVFEEGATLTLGMAALFGAIPDTDWYCFNRVLPASTSLGMDESRNLTLIGLNAQQYHNIGYDYYASRLYITHKQCDTV